MPKSVLFELRDTLAALVRELGDEGRTSREIGEEFIKRNGDLVGRASPELVLNGIVQQVVTVSARRNVPSLVPAQSDLFGLRIPYNLAVPKDAGRKPGKVRKNTESLTSEELDACIRDHSRPRAADIKLLAELKRLRELIRPFIRPGMSVGEALAIAQESGAAAAGAAKT